MADVQTNGRGRFDRVWNSASSDNIYMSFVIKPDNYQNYPFVNLTQYLSVIVNKIFNEKYNISSDIKWPNDILYKGKKLVGILSEAKVYNNQIVGIILGIGINVNSDKDYFTGLPNAISLKMILDKKIDKNELVKYVVDEFFANLDDFAEKGFISILDEYKLMCKFSDKSVKIGGSFMDGEYKFAGINDDGTFAVIDKNGNKINVVSGDILC